MLSEQKRSLKSEEQSVFFGEQGIQPLDPRI